MLDRPTRESEISIHARLWDRSHMKRIGWDRVRAATSAAVVALGVAVAHGADIEIYKAKEIEPVKPADDVKPTPPAPQPVPEADRSQDKKPAPADPQPKADETKNEPVKPVATAGNLVEPLSNG